jgi:hypothetical protein
MRQTAVEYLFKELWETPKDKLVWNKILKETKEYEKNQIKHAFGSGFVTDSNRWDFGKIMRQYIKENYK